MQRQPIQKGNLLLKASFLHDDAINWDDELSASSASDNLEDIFEGGSQQSSNDDDDESSDDEEEGGSSANNNKEESNDVDASTHNFSNHIRRMSAQSSSSKFIMAARQASQQSVQSSTTTHDDGSEQSTLTSEVSTSAHISGYGFNSALRQASASTISQSLQESGSPHDLAAAVAQSVKSHFITNIPSALQSDYNNRDTIAPFSTSEIVLGPLLGSGEFSHVYEIKGFKPNKDHETTLTQKEIETRKLMKRRERYHDTKKSCYAVKHLRPTLLDKYSKVEYAQSASDIALEAEFLCALQHPNIIKLRGISFSGPGGFAQGPKGYFLIIDKLNETLDARIKRWKKAKKKRMKKAGGIVPLRVVGRRGYKKSASADDAGSNNTNNGTKSSSGITLITEDQLDVGLQISSALMYLHEKNIMFRDLKPQNVGFDVRGDVKLFDFGLATVMPPNGDPYEEKYVMSGAGSPRYMAPEVLVDPPESYNMKADVYTFGIVLWEMFSLEVPYSDIKSRARLVNFVVDEQGRPPINDDWAEPIKEMLQLSFDADSDKRPNIRLFYNMIRFQLLNLRDGDDSKLTDRYIERRRSSYSLRHMIGTLVEEEGGEDNDNGVEQTNGTEVQEKKTKKNTFLNKLKPLQQPSSTAPAQVKPRRRRRPTTDLLNKFRLSVKHESSQE